MGKMGKRQKSDKKGKRINERWATRWEGGETGSATEREGGRAAEREDANATDREVGVG